jgi:hypothetical protein
MKLFPASYNVPFALELLIAAQDRIKDGLGNTSEDETKH